MPAADFFMPPDEMLAKRAAAVRRLLPEHLLRAAGVALPKTPTPDGADAVDEADESEGKNLKNAEDDGAWQRITIRRPTQKKAAADPLAIRRAADAWRAFGRLPGVELQEDARRWAGMGGDVLLPGTILWRTPEDFFRTLAAKPSAAKTADLPASPERWAAGVARLGALIDALGLPPREALTAARVLVREGAAFPPSGSSGASIASGMTEGDFAKLLLVLDWCRAHRPAGIYLRSIPLEGIDTKWIERHAAIVSSLDDLTRPQTYPANPDEPAEAAGEALPDADAPKRSAFERWQRRAGFRVLELPPLVLCRNTQAWLPAGVADADGADALARRAIQLPLAILQAAEPASPVVLIVENVQTGLAVDVPDDVPVFMGLGNAAAATVRALPWMGRKAVVYAGDLDVHGLEILARLRAAHGNVRSVLAGVEDFKRFEALAVDGATVAALGDYPRTDEEAALARMLFARREKLSRIEQERIPLAEVTAAVMAALKEAAAGGPR